MAHAALQLASASSKPNFASYAKAVVDGNVRLLDTQWGSQWTKASMSETGSGQIGGYLVPLDYSQRLLSVMSEVSIFGRLATVVPVTSAEIKLPMIDLETTPAAAGISPLFGGFVASWADDISTGPESEPAFRGMSLKPWNLIAYAIASNQFLMDTGSDAGENFLFDIFGRGIAWYADMAFFNGLGIPAYRPMGILNAPATISNKRQVAGAITPTDIANMMSNLVPFSAPNCVWACSSTCLAQICQMNNFWSNVPRTPGDGSRGCLLTCPLYVTDKLPALGSVGDLVLFDPRLYVIGQRTEILIDVSRDFKFANYQTMFRIWLRIDGRPWLTGPVTIVDVNNVSSVVSSYVALQ